MQLGRCGEKSTRNGRCHGCRDHGGVSILSTGSCGRYDTVVGRLISVSKIHTNSVERDSVGPYQNYDREIHHFVYSIKSMREDLDRIVSHISFDDNTVFER